MRHFLVTCGEMNRPNIIAVSFCMPVSKQPPLIACAIGRESHSCRLIEATKEFIVNVPTSMMREQIYYCGFHSGRNVDKFKETGFTPQSARLLKAPVIGQCPGHMECLVRQEVETGDKKLFIGEVVDAYADESFVKSGSAEGYAKGGFPVKIYGTRFKRD